MSVPCSLRSNRKRSWMSPNCARNCVYLQTREGKEMVAHSFGYIARGEKFIRPLNTKVPNRQMLLELLPVDVDGEVAKVIHELRQQGKGQKQLISYCA